MPPGTHSHDRIASQVEPIPGHPGFWSTPLTDQLARSLVERTLDTDDVRLREMTRDLNRFSSEGQLAEWRPGRDLLCLQDDAGSLLGLAWLADKPLPPREDYRDPGLMRRWNPGVTCAIRSYGKARGRGLLTKAFARCALRTLLGGRSPSTVLWYETKAENAWARALGRQMGFAEASGEAGGTVVGVRLPQ